MTLGNSPLRASCQQPGHWRQRCVLWVLLRHIAVQSECIDRGLIWVSGGSRPEFSAASLDSSSYSKHVLSPADSLTSFSCLFFSSSTAHCGSTCSFLSSFCCFSLRRGNVSVKSTGSWKITKYSGTLTLVVLTGCLLPWFSLKLFFQKCLGLVRS